MSGSRRSLAKRAAFALLGSPLVNRVRLRQIARAGVATVLSLHRVAPQDGSTYPPLDPQLFRRLLRYCKRHFSVVTFAELAAGAFDRPPLVLSFDDGYRDFYDYAAPIMAEEGVRCNHNLIPHAIETGQPPLNVILGDYVGRAPDEHLAALKVPGMARFRPGNDRSGYGNALSAFVKNRAMTEQHAIAAAIASQLARTRDFFPTPVMTLAQAREVAAVHEIGAHSFEHANLGHEDDAYISADAARCRVWFASQLGVAPTIYAVPNGDYRPHQLALIEAEGFDTILLVEQRFTRAGARHHHRFNFDAAGVAEMRFKALGALAPVA